MGKAKIIELYQPPCHQMKASIAIKRLQKLIEQHGDLKVDGLSGIAYWPADNEGPGFFFVELAQMLTERNEIKGLLWGLCRICVI